MKILIVEDDRMIATLVHEVLIRWGLSAVSRG